ncbi:MAG: HAD-IIB family hydrolase [Pyrodictiaceae archaeon]
MECCPRILVYTDLDECILDRSYSAGPATSLLQRLRLLGIPVVPSSSKTVHEMMYFLKTIGIGITPIGVIMVAEEGSAIYSSPGLLSEAHGMIVDYGLEIYELSPRLREIEWLVEDSLAACRDRVVRFTKAHPSLISKLTGLSYDLALLASKRTYTEVVWSPSKDCLGRIKRRAEELGLRVFQGRRFLHLAAHQGKIYALRVLLRQIPRLRSIEAVVALGDSELDREVIEEADIGIVIPHPEGLGVKPRRPYYLVASEPAPNGWIEAVSRLLVQLA